MKARVHSIQISAGGVPKRPAMTGEVYIGIDGIPGDAHVFHKHGGPEKAICLYSIDLIEDLRREGHAIDVGTTGENLTLIGVPWPVMRPGSRVWIRGVEMTITSFATPCQTIRDSFIDGRFVRISEKLSPGWSRVYARVETPGYIMIGDVVSIETP